MQSIRESSLKIKSWLARYWTHEADILLILIIVLVGSLGFGLGRLSKLEDGRQPITIELPVSPTPGPAGVAAVGEPTTAPTSPLPSGPAQGQLVGSKNSTRYHLPWCSGAKAIREENKIWFASADEAKAAGYTPAANCPGL